MNDAAVLAQWWSEVRRTGALPAGFAVVQSRLVRSVGRGELPSGPVFAKVMAFPRARDRLRYLLRPLPARHEAAMLRRLQAHGVPCPEVVGAYTARRAGLPAASFLVLRALPVAKQAAEPTDERGARRVLVERARLALRLVDAGVVHFDLNAGNFVPLEDGSLAVLDLQSARVRRGRALARGQRHMAMRLLTDAGPWLEPRAAADALASTGLVHTRERHALAVAAMRWRLRWLRGRVLRCLQESTEFAREFRWTGVLHRRRGEWPAGSWRSGGGELMRAWLGDRALQVMDGELPRLFALFRRWKWFPGKGSVYISAPSSPSQDAELTMRMEGHDRYRWLIEGRDPPAGWSGTRRQHGQGEGW